MIPESAAASAGPTSDPPRSSDLARAALDHVPAMLAYWDADLRCRCANRAYECWFGVKPEALLGRHISELLGPIYDLNRPHIEAALRGEPQEFEREIPNPLGGAARHSLATYTPDIVGGVVRGFYALVTDISVVKRSELALRQSEEQFRLTLEEAPIGMAVVGTDGRFLQVNRAFCGIVGYSARELVGMTFQAITHPDDLDTDVALARQLAQGEITRYSLEKRYIRKDGRVVDVELSGSVVRGENGQPLHFISQFEDITDRKRIERQQRFLAELGPVLASTFEPEQIFDGVVQLATRRFADFCVLDTVGALDEGQPVHRERVASRAPDKQWLTKSFLDLTIDHTKPSLLSEAIRTRLPVLLQHPTDQDLAALSQQPEHLRLLRALEIVSLLAVPMIAGERVIGAIALIASSGSREYEAGDVQMAQELAWRTAISLENARLYAAAGRATQMRDEVLAIVAHDLRNPLSTIAIQAEILRLQAQPGGGKEAAASEAIERAALRMKRLIEDLLDVSRMEAGQLSVQQAEMDTGRFLSECVESQRHLAEAASIDLRLQAPPELPPLWADRDRLSQVFENLVGNALKFTGSHGRITLCADARENEVLFSVRDTGAGIPPEHLPNLFDRFWQAGRDERGGAGLGLPIVKGVVEAHGGHIWVESTPGQGTCFLFTIPRADRRSELRRSTEIGGRKPGLPASSRIPKGATPSVPRR